METRSEATSIGETAARYCAGWASKPVPAFFAGTAGAAAAAAAGPAPGAPAALAAVTSPITGAGSGAPASPGPCTFVPN
ncbi:hypothetical protein GCM10010505_65510 [Kitasatospora aburaviensis]